MKKGSPVSERPHLLLLRYQNKFTHSFIHSFICQQTCLESLCASSMPGAADAEMNTELTGRQRQSCEETPWTSGPQPFCHQGPVSWKTVFPRTVGEGDGSGDNVSNGERWGAADEASLACLPLTTCCAPRFLTGRRLVPVPVCGLGVGDPCPRPHPTGAAVEEDARWNSDTGKPMVHSQKSKKESEKAFWRREAPVE